MSDRVPPRPPRPPAPPHHPSESLADHWLELTSNLKDLGAEVLYSLAVGVDRLAARARRLKGRHGRH